MIFHCGSAFAVMGIESPALRWAHPLHFHLEG